MTSNSSYDKLIVNDANIKNLTVENLTINPKKNSVANNYTTTIQKSKKIQCTLEQIVDHEHVILLSNDNELLYCGTKHIPDSTHISETFYGNIYYRYLMKKCVENENGRYSIIRKKCPPTRLILVYDWVQETFIIIANDFCLNFRYGFDKKYDLELVEYYTLFDTSLNKSSVDKTEVYIINSLNQCDKHYNAIINDKEIAIKIENVINENEYIGKTVNIPIIRKAIVSNLSLYNKSLIYDNNNFKTIIPQYYINNETSIFLEENNKEIIVAKRSKYLHFNDNNIPDLTKLNVIMFDVYFCSDIIVKDDSGNFVMIYNYDSIYNNKFIFYDKLNKNFIVVYLYYSISNFKSDRDKIGYTFKIDKLYKLYYARSYSFNNGNYILDTSGDKFVTLKNKNNNNIIAIKNIFNLTNNLYGKTLDFSLLSCFEYIYKH